MNLGDVIKNIGTFFEGLLQTISTAKFVTTSSAIVALIFGLIAIGMLFKVIFKWATEADKGNGFSEAVLSFGQFAGKKVLLWVAIGIAPVMFSSISSSVLGSVRGLISTVSGPAQGLMNTSGDAIKMIWASQMAIQMNLAREWPLLLDGLQDPADQIADAAIVSGQMTRMKQVAAENIAAQKAEAQRLTASPDPAKKAKGQRLLAEIQTQERKIQNATQVAEAQQAQAAEAAQAAAEDRDGKVSVQSLESGFMSVRALVGGLSLGFSELMLLLKRLIAGAIGLMSIAVPLFFALLMAWKLLQSIVSLFSHLAIYAGTLALSAALSQVLGPLAILAFGSSKTDRYGHQFVSFWLQAVVGTSCLVAAIKIVSVAIGGLAGVVANASFAAYSVVLATSGLGNTIVAGAVAALPFVAASYAVESFVQFIQKAPSAGTGLINGSFHP